MPSLTGGKWGISQSGTPGGVVTWSFAGANELLTVFGEQVQVFGRSVAPESFLTFDFEAAVQDAFDAWSSFGNIEFIQVEDGGGAAGGNPFADIRIFFGGIGGGFLGFGFFPPPLNGIEAGDILLQSTPSFNVSPSLFQALVLHEIGHALGLDHVGGQAIMNAQLVVDELQGDDILGIRSIYGIQDGAPSTYTLPSNRVEITILDAPENLTVMGNALNNVIVGPETALQVFGQGGGDTIVGGASDDFIDGGIGDDTLEGGGGFDFLLGGEGNDQLEGGGKSDLLDGGAGNDTIDGDEGEDLISLLNASGPTTLNLEDTALSSAEHQGDTYVSIEGVFGSQSFANSITGSASDDALIGGRQGDLIFGGDGVDALFSLDGDDTLDGGDGADALWSGRGSDTLTGGADFDAFMFRDDGADVVTDFSIAEGDVLLFFGGVVSAFSDLGFSTHASGDAVVSYGTGGAITLQGVTEAEINPTPGIQPLQILIA